MPKKKGKKGKKGKKKGTEEEKDGIFPAFVSLAELQARQQAAAPSVVYHDYVTLDVRMLNWKFMNFSRTVRANTTLKQVAAMIEARHGSVEEIRLFSSPPSLKTELVDRSLKLSDLGYKGADVEHPEVMILYYDYKATVGDPLLAFTMEPATVSSLT